MGKKSKKTDFIYSTFVEVGSGVETIVEDKKIKKMDTHDADDYDEHCRQKEKDQKGRKKRKLEFSKDMVDIVGTEPILVKNSGKLSREYKEKRKKKKEKKHEVGDDILLDVACDEAVNGNGGEEVDGSCQKEEHKKKSRKLKHKVSGNYLTKTSCEEEGKRSTCLEVNNEMSSEKNNDLDSRSDWKKKHKENRGKGKSDILSPPMKISDDQNISKDKGKVHKCPMNEDIDDKVEEKNNKRKRKNDNDIKVQRTNTNGAKGKRTSLDEQVEQGKAIEDPDWDVAEKVESKKRAREKRKMENELGAEFQEIIHDESANEGKITEVKEYAGGVCNAHSIVGKPQDRKVKSVKMQEKKKFKIIENQSKNPEPQGKLKKVRFSSHIEVFSSDDANHTRIQTPEENLVRGKRFSREEDAILREAVLNYIESHGLGEEGLEKVLNCRSYPEVRNCWKDIGTAIPSRPYIACYYRAHILFEGDEKHKWSAEELELVRKHQKEHGNDWKTLANKLGKHRFHVKDTWRRIKHRNMKSGHWSQEEYQTLFDLVNKDLRMKVFEEKKSKHGMLRDNICWGAISDELSTRNNADCCVKWYKQLSSSLVTEGVWADADDYHLIDSLFVLDASCIEDVEWDNLLEHRSGDLCRKRWYQMVRHIGHYGTKSFAEQVETLARRYCPDLLEAREAWDGKPVQP